MVQHVVIVSTSLGGASGQEVVMKTPAFGSDQIEQGSFSHPDKWGLIDVTWTCDVRDDRVAALRPHRSRTCCFGPKDRCSFSSSG